MESVLGNRMKYGLPINLLMVDINAVNGGGKVLTGCLSHLDEIRKL